MSTRLVAPPSMTDARAAARALAATQDVSEILVFGSVARDEAGPDSDIDLVAIHDDLDYSARRETSEHLRTLASEAAGHRVFVYVTDWPEWAHRSTEVTTSLEHAITSDAVILYHRDPNGVRWGKEIGMPTTDREEALGRLDNALRALLAVEDLLEMSRGERRALEDRDTGYYLHAISGRMRTLCSQAHMAMETSLKALVHLEGTRPARTHDLDRLLGGLPASRREELRGFFVEVTPKMASRWREAGAKEYADWSLDRLVPHTHHMARAGIAVSRYAAHRFPETDLARVIGKVASEIERMLDRWDLSADDPYEALGQSPPPELPSQSP